MWFLLSCYKDKELTVRMFASLFKNILNFVYIDNLKGVNFIYFVLDQLIGIHIPELFEKFNVKITNFII